MIDRPLQQSIDRLLMEQGEYTPLELLLAEGRLDYGDYESWREGAVLRLEDLLFGAPEPMYALLQQAENYLTALNLQPVPLSYRAWGQVNGPLLSFSPDPERERCFHTRYVKSDAEPQMDLFFDASAGRLVNGIVQALADRDTAAARRLLDRLFDADPGHGRLGALERLVEAAEGLHVPVTDPEGMLCYLQQELTPLAEKELGHESRNFLVSQWRRLTAALSAAPFDPDRPQRHVSYTAGRAYDWKRVAESVEAEAGWREEPLLLQRYAQACGRLRRQAESLEAWFRLCWCFPESASSLAAKAEPELQRAWQQFLELDPELEERDFPAWLLMMKPGLAERLSWPEGEAEAIPPSYQRLHGRLVSPDRAEGDLNEAGILFRKALKQEHPLLFGHYMNIRGNR